MDGKRPSPYSSAGAAPADRKPSPYAPGAMASGTPPGAAKERPSGGRRASVGDEEAGRSAEREAASLRSENRRLAAELKASFAPPSFLPWGGGALLTLPSLLTPPPTLGTFRRRTSLLQRHERSATMHGTSSAAQRKRPKQPLQRVWHPRRRPLRLRRHPWRQLQSSQGVVWMGRALKT